MRTGSRYHVSSPLTYHNTKASGGAQSLQRAVVSTIAGELGWLFTTIDYVMVMVSEMARSVHLYRDKLGIPIRFESPKWTEFETGSTVLALHGGGKVGGPKGSINPIGGTSSIGFYVEELIKHSVSWKRKVLCSLCPPTLRKKEGIRLSVCLDPDGLEISIAHA